MKPAHPSKGQTGLIVVDPLQFTEHARAVIALYRAHRGNRPVTAVGHDGGTTRGAHHARSAGHSFQGLSSYRKGEPRC